MSGAGTVGGVESAQIQAQVRATGLLPPGGRVVVLLSGGRDSVCLLDLARRLCGDVRALHCNYGLRAAAAQDEAHCRALCEALGVPLAVLRPERPERGNVQAWARAARYAEAERLAGDGLVAAGHTATDQVETVLYRLAAAPGRRALLGMPARAGRLVRPLLGVWREETAAYCAERGLPWREDTSNASPAYARNRTRHGLVAALRAIHPAAEANVLRTLAVLRDEAEVLDAAVEGALRAAGDPPAVAALAALPPALRRLAVQRLADDAAAAPHSDGALAHVAGVHDPDGGLAHAAGAPGPAVGDRADEILALAARGGSAALDLAGGLRARVEYGTLRIARAAPEPAAPAATRLAVPGTARFAGGALTSSRDLAAPPGDLTAVLDAAPLAATLEVRAWRHGDRMRPLGLGGSRSLQDLFTDRKVPRARRGRVPVVVSDGEIAWVPGVATAERFRVTAATRERVRLGWTAGA
jgi:tRNA(Ile)-lysidine synthase